MSNQLGGRTWGALLIFGLFGQIAWVIENMYFNVFLYNTISGDTRMIAAMVAWSAATATVTTLVMGALSDKIGKRKALIVVGYILWGISVAVFGLIDVKTMSKFVGEASAAYAAAVAVVIMDCIMTFFGSTANDACFNAWVTDVTTDNNRGRVETVLAIMPLIAMLLVFGVLDGYTQSGNWKTFFFIVAALTSLGGILGLIFIKEPKQLQRADGNYFENIVYGFKPSVIKVNRKLYWALIALGIYCISQQTYMPYLLIYIQKGLGIQDYTIMLGVVLIAASVISVSMGKTIDKRGKLVFLLPAGSVGVVGLILMYFAKQQIFIIVAGTVMLGGGMLISACCNGLIRDYTPDGKAGLFQGIRIVFQVLIPMVTGPYIGSAVTIKDGLTYNDLGVIKQIPSANIFLAAAVLLVFLLIPVYYLHKGEIKQ